MSSRESVLMIAEYLGIAEQEAERISLENAKRFYGIEGGMASYSRVSAGDNFFPSHPKVASPPGGGDFDA